MSKNAPMDIDLSSLEFWAPPYEERERRDLFLFYTANSKRFGAAESVKYFDTTRLEAEGR